MSEKVYIPAVRCFAPHQNAPSFKLASMVIDVYGFVDWINGPGKQYLSTYKNKKGDTTYQLTLDVLQSDKTGVNIQVNTYKSENAKT